MTVSLNLQPSQAFSLPSLFPQETSDVTKTAKVALQVFAGGCLMGGVIMTALAYASIVVEAGALGVGLLSLGAIALIVDAVLPASSQIETMRNHAKDNGFIAFYDKRNPLTECFGNFHICNMRVGDTSYICSEAAFQAQKDPCRRKEFCKLDGDGAFRHAKTVTPTADWIKGGRNLTAMREILSQKFKQNPYLGELLLATGNAYLVEHIPHDRHPPDAFWGDGHDGKGKNMLGKLLMELRGKLGGAGVVTKIPHDMHAKLQKSSLR